jgi:hypothetical protein
LPSMKLELLMTSGACSDVDPLTAIGVGRESASLHAGPVAHYSLL